MESEQITCPYCWQQIDTESPEPLGGEREVEFVTDCEVCCRPIRITARWEDSDSAPNLEATPEAE